MANAPRKKTLSPPRNAWERALDEAEGNDRSQAGEVELGNEPSGRGDQGVDPESGDGGYGGDAALAGLEESVTQADRPLDQEIHGDPRTHEGQSYPDEAKTLDERQGPIGQQSLDDDETDLDEGRARSSD